MTTYGGWVGKILRVDLTTRKISESSTFDYVPQFLGGRGLGAKICWDEVPPEVNAFDPENRLIFATGPLQGTLAPTSGRFEVVGKSSTIHSCGIIYPLRRRRTFCSRAKMGGLRCHYYSRERRRNPSTSGSPTKRPKSSMPKIYGDWILIKHSRCSGKFTEIRPE